MSRFDGRQPNELRPIKITANFLEHANGSCLIEFGKTRVICAVTVESNVPKWLKGSGSGWLTAEYSMLPGSSQSRIKRERGKVGGRTQEIQRLIGRTLRNGIDLKLLGERTVQIDCDVLDADGGTRTASITGAYIALRLAAENLRDDVPQLKEALYEQPQVAAISVGRYKNQALLDLNYEEDKDADTDMNVVMVSDGKFVEIQGTAESQPFDQDEFNEMLSLAKEGIEKLFQTQRDSLWS